MVYACFLSIFSLAGAELEHDSWMYIDKLMNQYIYFELKILLNMIQG